MRKKKTQRQQTSQIFVRYVSPAFFPSVGSNGSSTHRGTTKTFGKQPPSSKQQPTTCNVLKEPFVLFSDFSYPSPPSATGMFLFLFYLLVIYCLLGSIFCSHASESGNVLLTSPSVAPSKRRAIRGSISYNFLHLRSAVWATVWSMGKLSHASWQVHSYHLVIGH